MHSVSPFCTKNKFSAKEGKKRKKERYVTSGFHPETRDLIDEFAHQSNRSLSESKARAGLAEKRVAFLSWLLLSFSVDIKKKEVTGKKSFSKNKKRNCLTQFLFLFWVFISL
jgi:hypothetical protein